MSTINVNSSCDVLWISRQSREQVAQFFNVKDPVVVDNVGDAIKQIVSMGAVWLNSDFNPRTSANYLYPPDVGYSDVVQCTWSKDTTSPAGVFDVQLKPRVPYGELIKPGDVFIIFMDDRHRYGSSKDRTHGSLVTVGIVDRVGTSVAPDEQGAEIHTVSINGRDLGAVFQETELIYDKAFSQFEQTAFTNEWVTAVSEVVASLSPIEFVWTLLDLIYNQHATGSLIASKQWSFPNAVDKTGRPMSLLSLLNVTEFVQTNMFGFSTAASVGLAQAGNVWTLLESLCNGLVNEFFVDVRDFDWHNLELLNYQNEIAASVMGEEDVLRQKAASKKMLASGVWNQTTWNNQLGVATKPTLALVHRQMPFDKEAFSRLPVHHLYFDETYPFDVNVSMHDVINVFRIHFADLQNLQQELVYGLTVNQESVVRYGIRRMEGETKFAFSSSDNSDSYANGSGDVAFEDVYKYYVELLSTWHACNEQLLAGSVSCRFRPDIRVGNKLSYAASPDADVHSRTYLFYIQGLSHTFSVTPGSSRTSLTLVRGIEEVAGGLPNNLSWTAKEGRQIPNNLVNFVKTTPLDNAL